MPNSLFHLLEQLSSESLSTHPASALKFHISSLEEQP